MTRFMIAYDGSEGSMGALKRAVELMRQHDTLVVVSLVESYRAIAGTGFIFILFYFFKCLFF
jgi:hypothetical protein